MNHTRHAADIVRKRGERMLICLDQLASEMTARGAWGWGSHPRLRSGPRRREAREKFITDIGASFERRVCSIEVSWNVLLNLLVSGKSPAKSTTIFVALNISSQVWWWVPNDRARARDHARLRACVHGWVVRLRLVEFESRRQAALVATGRAPPCVILQYLAITAYLKSMAGLAAPLAGVVLRDHAPRASARPVGNRRSEPTDAHGFARVEFNSTRPRGCATTPRRFF